MTHSIDWQRLLEHRRRLADEPDEATILRRIQSWRELLEGDDPVPDEVLDQELVKLLEKIHSAL